jgi:hypothetical protein
MHTVTTISHLPGLSHLDNFCMINRLATLTHKSTYHDQWQASNPALLPGFLIATPPNGIARISNLIERLSYNLMA